MRVQLSSIKPDIKEIAKNNVHFFSFWKMSPFFPPKKICSHVMSFQLFF